MNNSNRLSVYAFWQFIAFVLVGLGTFIDMFRQENEERFGNTPCISLWGFKMMCYSSTLNDSSFSMFHKCPAKANCFLTAQLFAQISLVVVGSAAVVGITLLLCYPCLRWVCLLLNITVAVTGGFVVGCMVYANYNDFGTSSFCLRQEVGYKFGIGFQLLTAGWCLNTINTFFLNDSRGLANSN